MSNTNEDPENVPLLRPDRQAQSSPMPEAVAVSVPPEAVPMMAQYGATNPAGFPIPAQGDSNGHYMDAAAVAAAAAASAYGHQPHQGPPPYYYQGYPMPPQTGVFPPSAPPPGSYYPPQGYVYPPYNPAPPQRPPRAQRRLSGKSPTNSARKGQVEAVPGIVQAPSDDDSQKRGSSSIPPLQDIFSSDQQLMPNDPSSGAQPTNTATPKVYNAPPRAPQKSNKITPTLVKTESSGDSKHPLSGGGHRRINSDTPIRAMHRRLGSNDELPPTHRRRASGSARARSYSAGQVRKPAHRRVDSASSLASNLSMSSVVSNIAKSDFFGGVDEGGRVQMHFPFEAIRLVMVDPEKPVLRSGHLYLDGHAGDFDQFEEYHRITSSEDNMAPQWESLERPANLCGCTCNNCNGCLGKQQLLPTPNYMLAVHDNVYKRVLGEIADARTMPCGLFFCGHHEDVAHPSIQIAIILVIILFLCLMYFAILTGDLFVT